MSSPATEPFEPDADTIAAVDLGSNSFHLIVAQMTGGRLQVVDKIKDMVRLAAGLDAKNRLDEKVGARALESLERFGQRLRHLAPHQVRVVGTNTLRKARNRQDFLARAEAAIGHEIEIISGREEARLVYLGVSHSLEDRADRRLVIDIGGGSTELIIGRHFKAELMESLYMGCVAMSKRCFDCGAIKKSGFQRAVLLAKQELEAVQNVFLKAGWDRAVGASGTIVTAHEVLAHLDISRDGITLPGLYELRDRMIEAKHVDALQLPGLAKQRAPVFPGGVAILIALFEALDIQRLGASHGALREGLLHDMLGRTKREDIRDTTVLDLTERFHIDRTHAARVEETASYLLMNVAAAWQLAPTDWAQLLSWAARLHELGMDIAHSAYHKHGGYLLANMDMPGFSKLAQRRMAFLVRCHRRRFPTAPLDGFDTVHTRTLLRLAVLLRIAVLLHRSRANDAMPLMQVNASTEGDEDILEIVFPPDFLATHPLTNEDLAEEAAYLANAGLRLSYRE